jgi:hypothetical protein
VAKSRANRHWGQHQAAGLLAATSGAQNNQRAFSPAHHVDEAWPAENLPIDTRLTILEKWSIPMKTSTQTRIVLAGMMLAVVSGATAFLQSAGAQQPAPPVPQPTEEHKLLHKDVGTWDAEISLFLPGEAPVKSKGSEKNELLKGGMWLVSRFEGEMAGMEFAGTGLSGYDPIEKKYVGTWADSMSPHLMIIKGEYDPATKTMTSTGEGREPTGETYQARLVSRHLEDGTRTFEMHMRTPDGEFVKMMEIKYTRRAE